MGELIAIIAEKGGVGKTTTARNLGAGLVRRGKRVLLVDLDPQRNLSQITGAESAGLSAWDIITGKAKAADAVIKMPSGPDVIQSSAFLSMAAMELKGAGKNEIIKSALMPIAPDYDFIIMDTAPSLNMMTVNALAAARWLVLPVQVSYPCLLGLNTVYQNMEHVRSTINPALEIAGILLTFYATRNRLRRELEPMFDDAARSMGTRVFKSHIRHNSAIPEGESMRADIFSWSKRSNGAADFGAFTDEFLQTVEREHEPND